MKTKAKKIICFSVIAVILLMLLAGNIACGMLYQMITEFFHGTGVSFDDSEELTEVLNSGNALCSEIEAEGTVMLKGETPPLAGKDKVNIFGWAGSDGGWTISGYGSGANRIPEDKQVMLYKAFTDNGISYNTELADLYKEFRAARPGITSLDGNDRFFTLFEPTKSYYEKTDRDGKTVIDRAKEYSDAAVIVIGRVSGEGIDVPNYMYRSADGKHPADIKDTSRTYLAISPEEEELISLVTENFENVTVLLNTTNIIEAGFLNNDKIDSAFWVGAPGQSGTLAIPKVLKGEVNPSGRTTSTWAYDHKTDPSYANSVRWGTLGSNATYVEDVYVGYRWYETADAENYFADVSNEYGNGYDGVVQFPFGYGLDYTDFKWELRAADGGDAVSPEIGGSFSKNTTFKVNVCVTNTGERKGKDVVQLYYTPPYKTNGIEKASVNLAAFAKTIELEPGQSQYLTLEFDPYVMASYDAYDKNHNRYNGYELDKGEYVLSLRRNAHETVESFSYVLDMSIKYREDPDTGVKISNRYTGSSAYGGARLDARDVNPSLAYLTRADFKGTFSKTRADIKINDVSDTVNENVTVYEGYEGKKDGLGVENDLRIFVDKNGGKLNYSRLNSPDADIVYNHELVMDLGADYESDKWKPLLDQLSADEMEKLVVLGGYHTEAIESVGKIWVRENDGPMGLTRSNASTNEVTNWTWYPMVGVLAASWNSRLAYRFGNVVSSEANYTGVHGWYAPGFNILRSPYCGRNNEYYSEDPVFSGLIGMQTVKGALNNGVSCYIKHFAVNETETGRSGLKTHLTEQALREIYLKPFEIAVKKGGANGVMTAFNRVGTVWAGGSYPLLTEILRGEWGFRGGVITDWASSASGYMSGVQGLRAGNDLWLTGTGSNVHNLPMGWANDPVTLTLLRNASKNILYQFCNTYYLRQTHDPAEDELSVSVGVIEVNRPFPSWIFLLVGLDLVVLGGMTVWTVFLIKKPKASGKRKSGKSKDDPDAEAGDGQPSVQKENSAET